MRVDSFNLAKPSFKGYDARKLGGILMNSNYCGIAGEMLEITKKENLPLYILNRNEAGITISKNSVGEQPILKGCWAQDFWTVVKNKLQCFEEFGETEVVKKFFNLNFSRIPEYSLISLSIRFF